MGPARKLRLSALLLPALVLLGSCSSKPAGLLPVTGRVTYKGAHLPGGLIVFVPDVHRGENGAIAFGKIRDDGSYTLFTRDAEGASAGWYRVSVSSLAEAGPDSWPSPLSLVHEKYRDPELSMLSCEVKAERANQLDFNLD